MSPTGPPGCTQGGPERVGRQSVVTVTYLLRQLLRVLLRVRQQPPSVPRHLARLCHKYVAFVQEGAQFVGLREEQIRPLWALPAAEIAALLHTIAFFARSFETFGIVTVLLSYH